MHNLFYKELNKRRNYSVNFIHFCIISLFCKYGIHENLHLKFHLKCVKVNLGFHEYYPSFPLCFQISKQRDISRVWQKEYHDSREKLQRKNKIYHQRKDFLFFLRTTWLSRKLSIISFMVPNFQGKRYIKNTTRRT